MSEKRSINTLVNSDAIWTSTILVQAGHRINACIWIGSLASAALITTPLLSTASMSLALQRRLPGDSEYQWRDVKQWSVILTQALTANAEYMTPDPEPETTEVRMGCKEGSYESGTVYVRVGTT